MLASSSRIPRYLIRTTQPCVSSHWDDGFAIAIEKFLYLRTFETSIFFYVTCVISIFFFNRQISHLFIYFYLVIRIPYTIRWRIENRIQYYTHTHISRSCQILHSSSEVYKIAFKNLQFQMSRIKWIKIRKQSGNQCVFASMKTKKTT